MFQGNNETPCQTMSNTAFCCKLWANCRGRGRYQSSCFWTRVSLQGMIGTTAAKKRNRARRSRAGKCALQSSKHKTSRTQNRHRHRVFLTEVFGKALRRDKGLFGLIWWSSIGQWPSSPIFPAQLRLAPFAPSAFLKRPQGTTRGLCSGWGVTRGF